MGLLARFGVGGLKRVRDELSWEREVNRELRARVQELSQTVTALRGEVGPPSEGAGDVLAWVEDGCVVVSDRFVNEFAFIVPGDVDGLVRERAPELRGWRWVPVTKSDEFVGKRMREMGEEMGRG